MVSCACALRVCLSPLPPTSLGGGAGAGGTLALGPAAGSGFVEDTSDSPSWWVGLYLGSLSWGSGSPLSRQKAGMEAVSAVRKPVLW